MYKKGESYMTLQIYLSITIPIIFLASTVFFYITYKLKEKEYESLLKMDIGLEEMVKVERKLDDFVKKNNLSYSSTLEDFSKILNIEAGNTEEGLTAQAYIEKDNESGKKIVMFKPGLSDIEKEFAFAHEIAHIINNDAIPASRPDAHNKDFIEQRADYTAAAILMPINEVSTFLKEKKYDSLSRKGRMAIVKDLCEKYNVTEVNALRRIREIQKLEKNSSIL